MNILRFLLWLFGRKTEYNIQGYSVSYCIDDLKREWQNLRGKHIWAVIGVADIELNLDPPLFDPMWDIYLGKFEAFEEMVQRFAEVEEMGRLGAYYSNIGGMQILTCARRWERIKVLK